MSISIFSVGDRVRYVWPSQFGFVPRGTEGTVIGFNHQRKPRVQFDNGKICGLSQGHELAALERIDASDYVCDLDL